MATIKHRRIIRRKLRKLATGVVNKLVGTPAERRKRAQVQRARQKAQVTSLKRREAELRKKLIKALADGIKRDGLSCKKCRTIAAPIWGTRNRYRCLACKWQFAGANHHWDEMLYLDGVPVSSLTSDEQEAIYSAAAASVKRSFAASKSG